jgi:hypothetical protein
MNNDTEKVVARPETMMGIIAERMKEVTGQVPLHKLNRKARRAHFAQTGERVVGSNRPQLNPSKIAENTRKLIWGYAQAMGLRYSPHQYGLVDSTGKVVQKIDFNAEMESYKKKFL